MVDFAGLRRNMVDGQIRTNGVTDPRLIDALLDVPRERFVPPARAALAYIDEDIPVSGAGASSRWLVEPRVFARMLQALALQPGDKVLDVGSATGYSAAVLSRLTGQVVALEEDAALVETAARLCDELALGNVAVEKGPLAEGWPSTAPYDAIIVEGAVEAVSSNLLQQLRDNGRLVAVVGLGRAAQVTVFSRIGAEFSANSIFDAAVPPLPGFSKPKAFVF